MRPTTDAAERLTCLPAALALEVDALCDDFERHWQRARRRGNPPPDPQAFAARTTPAARLALRSCLQVLERELRNGPTLPKIPGWILEEEIGRGGMGVVYRARRTGGQAEDNRRVALKLILGAERVRWTSWLSELADLRHPNLVPLEGFGTHDGLHFVVMPLASGDLRERLAERKLTDPHDAARLMEKVARAVAFLHRRGILHRDLKPSNILLSDHDTWEPLVCDFGLAGRLDETTPEPRMVGTPPYVAPEQMEGRPLTVAADLWSLGAVLFEVLTGQPLRSLARSRKRLATRLPLERICRRCLMRDPAARYPSADDLANELIRFLDQRPQL